MSVLMFSGGVIMVVEGGKILNKFVDMDKEVDNSDSDIDKENIPDLSWLNTLPVKKVGWWMCGASTCLCALASLGLAAAIRPGNKVMLSFAVIVSIVAVLCITLGSLFLNRDSSIHTFLREQASDLLNEKYGKDLAFTKATNGVHYFVDCCGIEGPEDFGDSPPASCCEGNCTVTELGDRKATSTITVNVYKQKGCYDMILDLVVKNKGLLAFYGSFVSFLVAEAILGFTYLIFARLTPGPGTK
ncbi:hypothetical protein V1264_017505 [Littorina saxatilis]|uniref:Tetraspanin n=2 Tax=Littorina saxatilis TaxID=31220 RepID=A0AAN9BJC5_9CAEN